MIKSLSYTKECIQKENSFLGAGCWWLASSRRERRARKELDCEDYLLLGDLTDPDKGGEKEDNLEQTPTKEEDVRIYYYYIISI